MIIEVAKIRFTLLCDDYQLVNYLGYNKNRDLNTKTFFVKMVQSRPLVFIFVLFTFQFK